MRKYAEMVTARNCNQYLGSRIQEVVEVRAATVSLAATATPDALEKKEARHGRKDRFDVALAGGVFVVVWERERDERRSTHSA